MGDTESEIQTRQQAREEAEVFQTGGWYIAELDNPQLAVQSESEADARQKIAKRWEEYTEEPDEPDFRLGSPDEDTEPRRRELPPQHPALPPQTDA